MWGYVVRGGGFHAQREGFGGRAGDGRERENHMGRKCNLNLVIGCLYKSTLTLALPTPHLLSLSLHTSPQFIMAQVIVVGGGLAGLSAAHTLLERGANVLLLDKQG